MDLKDREQAIQAAATRKTDARPNCPFRPAVGVSPQKCTKQSGVCSLRLYGLKADQTVNVVGGDDGQLRCVCPYRFWEGNVVQEWIGSILLGTSAPLVVSEVPFLKPEIAAEISHSAEDESGSVGRIDQVLIHPNTDPLKWCALEMQAVYFSGPALSDDFPAFADATTAGIPYPKRIRRPDYRSSGPKRLMPQLQIKVPTLRRWGKKMAVVVDESFFRSLGRMDDVHDVSNSDIAWFIVGFDESGPRAKLVPRTVRFTTLERAVEGLTAGTPVTLDKFESEIQERLKRRKR